MLRTYAAHQEGGSREWELEPTALAGEAGVVRAVHGRRVDYPGFDGAGPRPQARATGAEARFPADIVLVAIGFAGVEDDPVYGQLGVNVASGTVAAGPGGSTSVPGAFAAGDCVRGADLIVTAIAEGRAAAAGIHAHLAQIAASPAA